MAIEVITEFIDKDTVRIIGYVKDDDGALVDPTACKVSVIDPDGATQIDEVAMSQTATGTYEYYYHTGETTDPMDKGEWRGYVLTVDGSGATAKISTGNYAFTVG